jgi:hypothetical protein
MIPRDVRSDHAICYWCGTEFRCQRITQDLRGLRDAPQYYLWRPAAAVEQDFHTVPLCDACYEGQVIIWALAAMVNG